MIGQPGVRGIEGRGRVDRARYRNYLELYVGVIFRFRGK